MRGEVDKSAKRNVAIVIGVGKVNDARFRPLRGAINAAEGFHEWAQSIGYQSHLITDKQTPVTFEGLRFEIEAALVGPRDPPLKAADARETINKALAQAAPIHRLLLVFAGHGLIKEMEQGLWFLSNSVAEQRVVDAEKLRRRLYRYGVGQIAIVADACRELPKTIDLADIVSDAVLGLGPKEVDDPPSIDKFVAAQDGALAYSIPGPTPDADRSLFSGVFLEALWGLKPDALFPPEKKFVTSQSLKIFLNNAVPERARAYKIKLKPNIDTNFNLGQDIYFGDVAPSVQPKPFVWPDPSKLLGMGAAPSEDGGGIGGLIAQTFSPNMAHLAVEALEGFTRFRKDVEWTDEAEAAKKTVADARRRAQRRGVAVRAKLAAQKKPVSFETRAGFAVSGARILRTLTGQGICAGDPGAQNWVHVGPPIPSHLAEAAPALMVLEGSLTLALTAMPSFLGSVVADATGAYALVYRQFFGPVPLSNGLLGDEAVAQLESGRLEGEALRDFVVQVRLQKHNDPTLGAISAYFYESLGDVESLRQMAYYYIKHDQPIPFDIVVLAALPVRRVDGKLVASVPATKPRPPLSEWERKHSWTFQATPADEGPVGGLWPWMRRGWAFLDDGPSDLIDPVLIEATKHLAPARFSTLRPEGAALLAERFGLAVRPDPIITQTSQTYEPRPNHVRTPILSKH